jgi:hypothetical protein
MATRQLILSDPLCFIVNKLGNIPLKPLKKTLIDFYSAEDISRAKSQLMKDVESMNLSDKPPHVSNRRENENRQVRETDDIFTLITFLDEHKLVESLPIYVTDRPDNMPTSRLFDGDLSFLSMRLDKLDTILSEHGSMLAAIFGDGHQPRRPTYASMVSRGGVNNNNKSAPDDTVTITSGKETTGNTGSQAGSTGSTAAGQAKPAVTLNENVNKTKNTDQLISIEKPSWSERLFDRLNSSSINTNQRLRMASDQAASSDIEANSAAESTDEQHFTEHHSRRSAKKRRRESPRQKSSANIINNPTQVKRGPLIVGNSAEFGGSVNPRGIKAANAPVKKSVFCIDNVNPLYSVDDVVEFVSDLHVNIVSCFEVKPRRRYSDDGENSFPRKAFRLCIHSNDCDLLLDASKWPDRVAIYDYFFKKKNINERETGQDITQDKPADARRPTRNLGSVPARSESPNPLSSLPPPAGVSGPCIRDAASNTNREEDNIEQSDDMDATILTPYSPNMSISTLDMSTSTLVNMVPTLNTEDGSI